jgi:hypothetical protein
MQPEVHRKATPPGDDSFQGLLHEDVQQVSNSELDQVMLPATAWQRCRSSSSTMLRTTHPPR